MNWTGFCFFFFLKRCGVPLFWTRRHNSENTGCGMLLTWSEGTKVIYKSIKRCTVYATLRIWGTLADCDNGGACVCGCLSCFWQHSPFTSRKRKKVEIRLLTQCENIIGRIVLYFLLHEATLAKYDWKTLLLQRLLPCCRHCRSSVLVSTLSML